MSRITRAFLFSFVLSFALVLPAGAATTAELSITPVVIDQKAKARDIIQASLTITNKSNRKLNLYPAVNDLHPETGEQSFSSAQNADDLEASLARWIELSRGVIDLGPGEEKTIPFVIRVSQNAAPGSYHALISFASGSTRDSAEAAGDLATAAVNLEVQADIKEIMQLNKFTTDNIVFTGDDVLFNYQLQNIGNQDLRPKGEIRIYDRKGEEIASLEVNGEGKNVSPDQVAQLASVWNGAAGFGRFKALLNVDYGSAQTASVSDSVYFWVIPWKQLLALTIVTLIAVIVLSLHFHRQLEERHLGKLARAGMLKVPEESASPTPAPIPAPVSTLPVPALVPQSSAPRRRLLGFLRRSAPVAETSVAPVPVPAAPAPQKAPIAQVLPVVPRTPARPSGTIDLKNLAPSGDVEPRVTQAHVINLR